MSFTCHSSFGPPAGHCFSRPVSRDIPSRCGPRHCGQSEVEAKFGEFHTDKGEKHKQSAAMEICNADFTVFSFEVSELVGFSVGCADYDLFQEMVPAEVTKGFGRGLTRMTRI
jgi:hypothetical protein